MQVPIQSVHAAIAGTGSAQSKSSEAENQQTSSADAARRAGLGQESASDELSIDSSAKAEDRGGNGQQALAHPSPQNEEQSPENEDATQGKPQEDGLGEQLDLEA